MTADKSDETSKRKEARQSSDSLSENISASKSSDQQTWKLMEAPHYLEQDESATDLFYGQGERGKGQNKFAIDGLSVAKGNELGDSCEEPELVGRVAWDLPDISKLQTEAKQAFDNFCHPHAARPFEYTDMAVAAQSLKHLPRLSEFSDRNGNIGARLITAIMLNEQLYYTQGKDSIPDAIVSTFGWFPANPTVGPAQIKLSYLRPLVKAYPLLLGSPDEAAKCSTEKTYATKLTAAYLEERIKKFESWDKIPPSSDWLSNDERLLFKHAYPYWKEGKQTEALIMSYNPGAGKAHLDNVKNRLAELK